MYQSLKVQIRKDAKRLFSVVLCALLLLSAWVFVAPETLPQASAVTATFSSYKAVFQFKITDDADDENCKVVVWANGYKNYGASSSIDDIASKTWGTTNTGTWNDQEISLGTAVPSGLEVHFYRSGGTVSRSAAFEVNSIKFYGVTSSGSTVQIGTQGNFSGSKDARNWDQWYGDQSALSRPTLSANLSAASATVDIPYSAGTTQTFTSWASDNRSSTKLPIPTNSSVGSMTQTLTDNNNPRTNVTLSNYSDRADNVLHTLNIPTSAHNGGVSSRTVTVDVKYTSGDRNSTKTFTLTLKDYAKIQYNKNGGTSINVTDPYYTYDKKVPTGSFPSDGVYAGHEFIGMYDTQKTVSYAATKPTAGSTTGYTDQLTATKETTDDTTYYAAWWAKNVTVKYLNNDGSVLKTSDVAKYNQKASYAAAAAAPGNPSYVYAPGASHGTYEYVFDHWEVVEAKQYGNDGTQSERNDAVGENYNTAVLKGDTTFRAVYRIKGNTPTKYTITYKNGSETTSNANLTYKADGYKTATFPATTEESKTYTYTFLGWAEQVNSNDTVYFQDWNEDAGAYVPQNNAQTPLTDYKVYSSKTWVAVYGRKYIDYTVTFNFVGVSTDETGATVYDSSNQIVYTKHYNETIEIPAPESYTGGKLTGTAPTGVTYSNAIGNTYSFSGWSGGTPSATVTASGTFTATYTATPANYTIKFVDYDGTVLNEGNTSFNHGTSVTSAKQTADANVTQTWRDDDNEYTFTGWAPAYASTATDNVTYTAQYESTTLYTVTYADESGTLATWKGTTAENIPYMPAGITADPTKDDDEYATDYTFSGWATTEYDRANPVTPAITTTRNMKVPEGGTTVFAQFTRTPIIYTINFIYGNPDAEGVMPDHKQELEYGQEVTIPTNTTRDDDDVYKYEFRGWDKTVSETVDGNATYTALYRKSYVYYTVAWYQPDLTTTAQNITINGEQGIYFAPTTEKVRPDETYIYNSLISAPYQKPNTPDKPDDQSAYILAGWIYKGTTDVLTRADRVVAENHMSTDGLAENRAGKIELVPVFVLKADVKTVTFLDEDGTLIGTQEVGFGTELQNVNVGTLPAKSATDDEHYTLDGWMLKNADDSFGPDILADTYEIEEDITVKAKFSAKPHKYEVVETTAAPTFFQEGEGAIFCEACHKTGTVTLPTLTDGVAPTGRIMVKGNKWMTISDTAAEVLTAGQSTFIINTADTANATTYYFNKTTKEIVTAIPEGADAADYQELTYNAAGTGSQTGDIYIHASKTPVDPATVTGDETSGGWYNCFNYAEYHELNPGATEANFSDIVSQIANEIDVEDGESFIIYVKIVDRCGNTFYISTAPLKYDGTAPEITITDTGFDAALNPDVTPAAAPATQTKFCTEVTIAVDDGSYYFISKGGEELDTVSNKLNEAGEYTITAYDEAGNMSRRVVQIIGSHSPKAVVTAATCTEKGSSYDVCRLCGMTLTAATETPALGHSEKVRIKQPTCTENGSVTITCRRCSDLNVTYTTTEDLRAHDYEDLIATGEHTWGEWVVKTAATCSATGEKNRICEKCGEEETEVLPIDENAHRWSTTVYTTPATCEEAGETYRICRWNEEHKQHVDDLAPTGHIADTDRGWIETVHPTCTEKGTEVQYCKYHDTVVVNTRDVNPLGHDFSVKGETVPAYYDADNNPVQGYTIYKCSRCDETEKRDFTNPAANVSVTFVVNGVESAPVMVAKNSTLNTVTKPDTTKAADETYRYTFAGWKKAEKNAEDEWTATGDVLKDTFAIAEDVTLIATYDEYFVNYTVTFYKDDGATRHYINGYVHYNEELNVTTPTKDEDATATYTFAGWKKAVKNEETGKWEATGDIVSPIICTGDENYIAVFTATPKTYTVIWADRASSDYVAVKTLTNVAGGSDVSGQAPALPASTKKADSNGHWIVTGWDQEPTNVTSNLVIRPVLVQEAHNYAITNTPADCTNPAKTVYTCACGYSYSIANGKAKGHTWTVLERVNPTATADGYELRECSVCHIQERVVLDKTGMINLTINVKDNNGNPVSGANVRVYDGNTLVASGVTDGSGKAVVQVPEAKTYRIEIDGNGINGASGTITVDENGRITGGGVPTVSRPSGHGCDCTCHKSGLWPSIFRFFHKIIKLITGEFRCCPDAKY